MKKHKLKLEEKLDKLNFIQLLSEFSFVLLLFFRCCLSVESFFIGVLCRVFFVRKPPITNMIYCKMIFPVNASWR